MINKKGKRKLGEEKIVLQDFWTKALRQAFRVGFERGYYGGMERVHVNLTELADEWIKSIVVSVDMGEPYASN